MEVQFWCDKGFAEQAGQILSAHNTSIRLRTVVAGKFRRYHHLTLLQHLLIPSIIFLNLRDLFLVICGFLQSFARLVIWRPDVVFTKGGFVCLPVGWAAWCLRIPLVIHDSDVVPGLTNRLLAKKATAIGTGAPLENYPYDVSKSRYVGIPIGADFVPFSAEHQSRAKKELGFDSKKPLVVVIGGGLGAAPLNNAVVMNYDKLTAMANVLLLSGKLQYEDVRAQLPDDSPHFQLHAFISGGIVNVLGAADVVVSRAGATALLELAALRKPTVLVPSSRLVWQVKHAAMFEKAGAVLYLDETQFDQGGDTSFVDGISKIIASSAVRESLAKNIAALAMPHAARDMADMVEHAALKKH